jgi:hypothetical protein
VNAGTPRAVLELHVAEMRQLFNAMDPAPFRERDLGRRISLVIGLVFLAGAIALGDFIASLVAKDSHGGIIQETFVIGGWVALWRPLEIFLYDWWPIRAEAKLYDRLREMPVHLVDASASAEAGKRVDRNDRQD